MEQKKCTKKVIKNKSTLTSNLLSQVGILLESLFYCLSIDI